MKRKTEEKIKHALGREDRPKKAHHVTGMHIRRAANGGFIAHHDMADEDGNPAVDPGGQDHIIPSMDAAHAHLDQHMGDQPDAGDEEADAGAGAAAGAPPPDAGAGQQVA